MKLIRKGERKKIDVREKWKGSSRRSGNRSGKVVKKVVKKGVKNCEKKLS